MISKRQWQDCLARAKDGVTLREAVNTEIELMDATLSGLGIDTLRLVRQGGTWRVTVNGEYSSGGYAGLSEVLDSLSRIPVGFWEGDHGNP